MRDIRKEWILDLIERAERGERKAAIQLLEEFCGAVAQNAAQGREVKGRKVSLLKKGQPILSHVPIDVEVSRYFAQRFSMVLDGVDANDALGVKNPSHRSESPDKAQREQAMSLRVARFCQQGKSLDQAISQVAREMVGEGTLENPDKGKEVVKKAYYKYRYASELTLRLEKLDTKALVDK